MPDVRVRNRAQPDGAATPGDARTALFNYLFARHTGGTFIFRLEDTDQARSTEAYELDILEASTGWGFGGTKDRASATSRSAARTAVSPDAAPGALHGSCYAAAGRGQGLLLLLHPEELDAERKRQEAARETPRYNGRCAQLTQADRAVFEVEGRTPVVRFRIPANRTIAFDDIVRGHVEIDTNVLGGTW